MNYGCLRLSIDKQDENNQKLGVDRKAEELGIKFNKYYVEQLRIAFKYKKWNS